MRSSLSFDWAAGRRLAGALALLFCTTCTDAGSSLVIMQAQVLEEGCSVPAEESEVRRDHGVLDVALDRDYPYYLFPLVSNRLPKIGEKGDVEPNRVSVTGARIRLEPPPGVTVPWRSDCPAEFDHPSQAGLEPEGMASLIVQAVRPCHTALFRAMFNARALNPSVSEAIHFRAIVRARGKHGSSTLLSEPFEFPIRICFGCLQTGFTGAFSQFNFPALPSCERLGEHPFTGNPCNPAQDFGPVLCCAVDPQGSMLECPARPRVTEPPR